ncbi:TMEM175 family protein [Lacticaseibacillus zhaodongensis]|uniref:TMEM175 family protein n=1 Tax=Lacticaseibacillus zhaodongensis TaxID=2668065 RepID=UPI0012D30180|nr:TMEM175 family protein [Lacticaseibacillus zhaodongensis]
MSEKRMVAFTDGILAIIITVMVLEFKAPRADTFAALWSLRSEFIIYLASYLILAVYWINHHHLFQIVHHVSTPILWANMLMLLTMSFYPFATAWIGTHPLIALVPAAFYGFVNMLTNGAYALLVWTLICDNRKRKAPVAILRRGLNKTLITIGINVIAIGCGFLWAPSVVIIDVLTIAGWALPDQVLERHVAERDRTPQRK